MCVGDGKGAVGLGIFFYCFLVNTIVLFKIGKRFRIVWMCIQVQGRIYAGKSIKHDVFHELLPGKSVCPSGEILSLSRGSAAAALRLLAGHGGASLLVCLLLGRSGPLVWAKAGIHTVLILHHRTTPRFPKNGLFSSGNIVPH